jgi:hypothetical protein
MSIFDQLKTIAAKILDANAFAVSSAEAALQTVEAALAYAQAESDKKPGSSKSEGIILNNAQTSLKTMKVGATNARNAANLAVNFANNINESNPNAFTAVQNISVDVTKAATDAIANAREPMQAAITVIIQTNDSRIQYGKYTNANAANERARNALQSLQLTFNNIDAKNLMKLLKEQEALQAATDVLNLAKTAAAEIDRLQAAAKAKADAQAAAQAALDAAQNASANALAALNAKKGEYETAKKNVTPAQEVYNNAQNEVNGAKANKAAYDDALAQQTAANVLLTAATAALFAANTKAQENVNKTYAEDSTLLKNAASFPNSTFGIDKQYNEMAADWAAYNAAKTALSTIDTKNLSSVTTATDKVVEMYNKFLTSKGVYSNAVISALQSNKTDSTYIENSTNDMKTYGLIYDITKEFTAMTNAWTNVTTSLKASNASEVIRNYIAYLPTKTAFMKSLLIAQNKKAEADFITNLAAGKDAAAKWVLTGTKGCRNIQTIASTDPNMLDQDIACSDTEYISGYTKVSGYNAAPIDPNVSRDNISQYLAVKYSCCIAPEGTKGQRGKQGLPGVDGDSGGMGPIGLVGPNGPVGNKGDIGDSGEEGGKGPAGDKGEDGTMGAAGPPGKPGTSMKAPYIRQLPGPMGQIGQEGSRGVRGPKGPDGVVKPAPVESPSPLDKTIALFNLQEKINNYMNN